MILIKLTLLDDEGALMEFRDVLLPAVPRVGEHLRANGLDAPFVVEAVEYEAGLRERLGPDISRPVTVTARHTRTNRTESPLEADDEENVALRVRLQMAEEAVKEWEDRYASALDQTQRALDFARDLLTRPRD